MPKDPMSGLISHWYHLVENFQASPLEFYGSVERGIEARQVPEALRSRVDFREGGILSAHREYLRIARGRHVFDICASPFGNGFFFSWWLSERPSSLTPFLTIGLFVAILVLGFLLMNELGFFEGLVFLLIGIAVFFVFFRLMVRQGTFGQDVEHAMLDVPYIGAIYERIFKPTTYYRMDTALMFQESVRRAVLDGVDELTKAKGVRSLTELERKPILKEFFRR